MFLPDSLGPRTSNQEYSSDKDSDYEPPDYVQEEILHESPILTRSLATQMEKEEALRRILESKINRYPLRDYINLGSGFDIQLRPNYYESDQEEEEEIIHGRRRHSFSMPSVQEEDEESHEYNLNKKRQQRRYSEGSTICLRKKDIEDSNVDETYVNTESDKSKARSKSESERDSLCITRTLTYKSKDQIIKLYQTEHLNVDLPQNKTIGEAVCDNDSYLDKQCVSKETKPRNEEGKSKNCLLNYKNENYISNKHNADLLFSLRYEDRNDIRKHMEDMYRKLQDQRKETYLQNACNEHIISSASYNKIYFLGLLGLKYQQSELEKNVLKLMVENATQKRDMVTQTECESIAGIENNNKCSEIENSKEKPNIANKSSKTKRNLKHNLVQSQKTVPLKSCNQVCGEKESQKFNKNIRPSNKFSSTTTDEKLKKANTKSKSFKEFTSLGKNVKNTNLQLKNNQSQSEVYKTMSCVENKKLKKEKPNFCRNQMPTYYDVIRRACDNLFKPDTVLQKDSDKTQSELNAKKIKKASVSSTKLMHGKEPPHKEKNTSCKCSTDSKKSKKQETIRKVSRKAIQKKENDQNEKRPQYNIEEVERKLNRLFGDTENEVILDKVREEKKESSKTTSRTHKPAKCRNDKNLHQKQAICKHKPLRYCILHNKKPSCKKKTKRESEQLKNQKTTSKEKLQSLKHSNDSSSKEEADIHTHIKVLKEKRQTLCKLKSVLEKTICSKDIHSENSSNSVLDKLKEPTKEPRSMTEEKCSTQKDREVFKEPSKRKDTVENSQLESSDNEVLEKSVESEQNAVKTLDNKNKSIDGETQLLEEICESLEEQSNCAKDSNQVVQEFIADSGHTEFKECIEVEKQRATENLTLSEVNTVENEDFVHNCCCCSPQNTSENQSREKLESDCETKEQQSTSEENEEIEIISLCDSSMDEADMQANLVTNVGCCCCCSEEEFLPNENVVIDITQDDLQHNTNIIVLDEDESETRPSSPAKETIFALSPVEDTVLNDVSEDSQGVNVVETNDASNTTSDAEKTNTTDTNESMSSSKTVIEESMFPDESEEEQDLQGLIITLTDTIDKSPNPSNCQEVESGKSIDNNPNDVKLTPVAGHPSMTDMEHYKKRLIHQHEKPGALSSPCTTTEEEEDSPLESPLSPASSGQSRDSGSQDKRREEVVHLKVARKRAVCRSQFRHQNMELFKLGNSIPTFLCKTREPYSVCSEKNLQMCYQNGGQKKWEKTTSKGCLTESIIKSIEGGKRKEVPLSRSVSLNNEISERRNPFSTSNKETKSSGNGRHILPAIVPELPEPRKNRIKSLPEPIKVRAVENNKHPNGTSSKFTEGSEQIVMQKSMGVVGENSVIRKIPVEHRTNESVIQSVTQKSTTDAPMNLSMKSRDTVISQLPRPDLVNTHGATKTESNSSQHLGHAIPKQPNNVPKKPPIQEIQNLTRAVVNENFDTGTKAKDVERNCVFVTAIPSEALDPQKQSNVIVINFPHIQQQMSRMERPNVALPGPVETQQSPLEMLDSAIMSLVNIVKSSVESIFNILSLPVLNRLYMDLSRYLLLPTVSVKMKMCIEEALNALISYLLVNLFRAPRNSKARSFVHKILQLDLRPHMDFLISSLDSIQQKIKYDYFMDHLLKVLAHNPQEGLPSYVGRHLGNFPNRHGFPPPPPYLPHPNQHVPPEFRDFPPGRYWMENLAYQNRPPDYMGNVPPKRPQKRGRRQGHGAEMNLMGGGKVLENFNGPNLAMMRPDLYVGDNRCIPPNNLHVFPETPFMNAPNQARPPKGRPRNSIKQNRIPNRSTEHSALLLLPELSEERAIYRENQFVDRLGRNGENTPAMYNPLVDHRERVCDLANNNSNATMRKDMRRNSDIIPHREILDENIRFHIPSRITEEKTLPENVLLGYRGVKNSENVFNGNNLEHFLQQEMIIADNETHRQINSVNVTINEPGNTFVDRTKLPHMPVPNKDSNVNVMNNATLNKEMEEINGKNLPAQASDTTKVVIISNDVISQQNVPNKTVPVNSDAVTKIAQASVIKERDTALKQSVVSDIEQFLQTNIIVNKNQTKSVLANGSSTAKNIQNVIENVGNADYPDKNLPLGGGSNPTSDLQITNPVTNSEAIEDKIARVDNHPNQEPVEVTSSNGIPEVVSGTVIINDKSMEISKHDISELDDNRPLAADNNTMTLDDVVLERVSPGSTEVRNGISYTCASGSGGTGKPTEDIKRVTKDGNTQARTLLTTDISIEKVTDDFDTPPKLIKLSTLKRKIEESRQQKKRPKSEVAEKRESKSLDHNQNDIGNGANVNQVPENITSPVSDTKTQVGGNKQPTVPIIEDISSDEEDLPPFRLYSTYDSKIDGDPRKILQTTEVSICTLIEGSVEAIKDANPHLFEKPPVYTRPVMPRSMRKSVEEENPAPRRELLANLIQFEEDSDTLTCTLKVKDNSELKYPNTIDVRRFSPAHIYQFVENVSPASSPNFKSPTGPVPVSPSVVQTSPRFRKSPVVHTSPVVQKSPVVPASPVVPISPAIIQMSPAAPPLDESTFNWGHWFSDEQKRGVFNFERSQSMESSVVSGRQSVEALSNAGSDYCPKLSSGETFREIKIDSKTYRIKKNLYEKIPKGKLCYVRESNTFIRYFDDNQMELFISNLSESSTVKSDLLKQVRGRTDSSSGIETSTETSGKGEVIMLSKEVVFSTEDFLSDPELYVEEVEKVQRYVPKDFYGFYKFVTGYQIVNHHPPISFQTFLTMHNTNGIKGLFKNYVNTLVEGRNIL